MKDDIKILLYNKINIVLLEEWDPIGIKNIPEAHDEYEAYAVPILKLLISGKREREIFKYLWWVETEYMGLQGNKQTTKHIAKKLSNLLNTI
jgi:hypothetical protein